MGRPAGAKRLPPSGLAVHLCSGDHAGPCACCFESGCSRFTRAPLVLRPFLASAFYGQHVLGRGNALSRVPAPSLRLLGALEVSLSPFGGVGDRCGNSGTVRSSQSEFEVSFGVGLVSTSPCSGSRTSTGDSGRLCTGLTEAQRERCSHRDRKHLCRGLGDSPLSLGRLWSTRQITRGPDSFPGNHLALISSCLKL